jgi:hypothetical protein
MIIDLTGKKFGRYAVISRIEGLSRNVAMWHCVCDCGSSRAVSSASLRNGSAKSCGCLARERSSERIKARTRPLAERFWAKVTKHEDASRCWSWTAAKTPKGYGVIGSGGHRSPNTLAHRVSWEIANGSIPDGLFVLHRCDNPECTNPAHLFLGTNDDNIADMRAKNRNVDPPRRVGEAVNTHKLTATQVVQIRARFAAGIESQSAIARAFGVTSQQVGHIVRGEQWKHVA